MFKVHHVDHPNLIVVHYPAFAGGKFFINCLAHHPGIIPLINVRNQGYKWLLADIEPWAKEKLKINLINSTLPPIDKMKNWCDYELGHFEMWGVDCLELTHNQEPVPEQTRQLLDNYICFSVNHNISLNNYVKIKTELPNTKHIILNNSLKFQQLASQLKVNAAHTASINDFQVNDEQSFHVDVDSAWGNLDVASTMYTVMQCVTWLGLDQQQLNPNVYSFVENYFKLHQQ